MKSRPLLTTPHVAAEVMKLRARSRLASESSDFRRFALTFLGGPDIEEVPCSVTELNQEDFSSLVCRFGLTDAALIFVAAGRRCLLLTDDGELFSTYSAGTQFEIRLLDEYLRQEI